ncbi:unnamed protein product [Clonostachys rosea]|uniref:Peptidase S8/S53 domain-containing protein n=1 Tax=Bionectria ochroleuca TaxID=29856 RepID=A0ABY6V2D5_BIOOC|nr:unnamed protein product [Clonostachys rosea]
MDSAASADEWMRYFSSFRSPLNGYEAGGEGVRVAILDTGIHQSLLENVDAEQSFLDDSHGSNKAEDEPSSLHGSHIASLVQGLAPWASIYIARVARDEHTDISPAAFAEASE